METGKRKLLESFHHQLVTTLLPNYLLGFRPVTLIGFSLGARVIFKCLQCLAETGEENRKLIHSFLSLYFFFCLIAIRTLAGGIVERVVLLGGPISIKDENWHIIRKVD